MDILTSAADALLDSSVVCGNKSPPFATKSSLSILNDITNLTPSTNHGTSSFNALLTGKITTKAKLNSKRKRKLYPDENVDPNPKTPKGKFQLDRKDNSPITPTSNLKLLTRIASMEEPMLRKKLLFGRGQEPTTSSVVKCKLRRSLSENCDAASKLEPSSSKLKRHPTCNEFAVPPSSPFSSTMNAVPSAEFSRKEKSLGFLCEKFLEHFPLEVSFLETPRKLIIDDVAVLLNTERRRVYDIVNILECLNMATRVQKNMYQWIGKQNLENTLARLKALALKWGIGNHLNIPIEQTLKQLQQKQNSDSNGQSKIEPRKERSLGILCQKFLMLFLTSDSPHIVQLDTAIHLLLGREGENVEMARLRGRRIYDIANVLTALSLIKKLLQSKCFQYMGPLVEAAPVVDDISPGQQSICRHSLLPLRQQLPSSMNEDFSDHLDVTPYYCNQPELKKISNPRKLATEFASKENSVSNRSQSAERISNAGQASKITRQPSLQDICQVASLERERILLQEKSDSEGPISQEPQAGMNSEGNKKTYSFYRLSSPRVALTFTQNTTKETPTSERSFQIVKKNVLQNNSLSKAQDSKLIGKAQGPVFIVRAIPSASKAITPLVSAKSPEDSKVGLPSCSSVRINQNILNISARRQQIGFRPVKSLPNVNLNTLSRNHYKTTFGSLSQVKVQPNGSYKSNGAYHFVIGNKGTSPEGQDAFVKVSLPSPDSCSSAESELDSIFGDSFKFICPKVAAKNI